MAPSGRAEGPVAQDQLERHGFVHCCFREQLTEIASWWFDAVDELVALELEPSRLRSDLRFERSPSRWYPHLYGPIDPEAVVHAYAVPRHADGTADLPPALRQPPPTFRLTGRVAPGGAEVAVRWHPGRLEGDAAWTAAADAARNEGRLVPLVGGVLVAPTLDRAYESFALLELVADEVTGYEGDGFSG